MSDGPVYGCELPNNLEKVLATLSIHYGKTGKTLLQRLIVNSAYSVIEETAYDNWQGGQHGHAIYFYVPSTIYFEVVDQLADVAKEIATGINQISNVRNEYIEGVYLEIQADEALENWRENSGQLIQPRSVEIDISEAQLAVIWEPGQVRLFLGHKSSYKKEASELKIALSTYGVSCFVAHEDIKPTKEWQTEIERALFSMHSLAALMTEGFSNSDWTDQEIGVAIGRCIPIISVRLGMDPYGFIGKYQSLSCKSKSITQLAEALYNLLWMKPVLGEQLTDSLVTSFENAGSYDDAGRLMSRLHKITNASPEIIARLESAPQGNSQLRDSFKVRRELPGLVNRLRGVRGQ